MEASSAFHRCVWQAFTRPIHCRHIVTSTRLISKTSRQNTARTSSRTFTSTSQTQRDAPPQPQPVSQEKSTEQAVAALPPQRQTRPKPNEDNRIDLSSLPGIPSSYVPPRNTTKQEPSQPGSARAQLNSLFDRPQRSTENPFERTIRQTDAMNNTSPYPGSSKKPLLNFSSLLDSLDLGQSSSNPQTLNANPKLALRLRPTLGRTQSVDNSRGLDLTRAFRLLEMKCAANKVRSDVVRQRFHVRRGQRRKLDRSFRWRTAFKAGFLEECARVRRMKNQGW